MTSPMRTIVDIPEDVIKNLDEVGSNEHRSRAALIRDALDSYLNEHYVKDSSDVSFILKRLMLLYTQLHENRGVS